MKLPPLVARVRVRTPRRSLRLWVPLFLVWLLLAVVLAPVLVLALLAALAAPPRWRFLPLARGAWGTVCEARGSCVRLEGARGEIFVSLH